MKDKILKIIRRNAETRPAPFVVVFNGVEYNTITIISEQKFEQIATEIASLFKEMVSKEEMFEFIIWIGVMKATVSNITLKWTIPYILVDVSIDKVYEQFKNSKK